MRSTSALVLVGALMLTGCASDPSGAIEEADPGVEGTIAPPGAEETTGVGEPTDEATG